MFPSFSRFLRCLKFPSPDIYPFCMISHAHWNPSSFSSPVVQLLTVLCLVWLISWKHRLRILFSFATKTFSPRHSWLLWSRHCRRHWNQCPMHGNGTLRPARGKSIQAKVLLSSLTFLYLMSHWLHLTTSTLTHVPLCNISSTSWCSSSDF